MIREHVEVLCAFLSLMELSTESELPKQLLLPEVMEEPTFPVHPLIHVPEMVALWSQELVYH